MIESAYGHFLTEKGKQDEAINERKIVIWTG